MLAHMGTRCAPRARRRPANLQPFGAQTALRPLLAGGTIPRRATSRCPVLHAPRDHHAQAPGRIPPVLQRGIAPHFLGARPPRRGLPPPERSAAARQSPTPDGRLPPTPVR